MKTSSEHRDLIDLWYNGQTPDISDYDEFRENCESLRNAEEGEWTIPTREQFEAVIRDPLDGLPNDERRVTTEKYPTLPALYRAMLLREIDGDDWTDLPIYSDDEPTDTTEVWSWDATHYIGGACTSDLGLIRRDDPNGFAFDRWPENAPTYRVHISTPLGGSFDVEEVDGELVARCDSRNGNTKYFTDRTEAEAVAANIRASLDGDWVPGTTVDVIEN